MGSRNVVMGKIAASYGVRGWLKVQPFTAAPDSLLRYPQWTLRNERNGREIDYRLLEGREHGGFLTVLLSNISSREDAAALRGWLITVPRDALPDSGENNVYFTDLIGLRVINRENTTLGIIDDVREYGAQPVLHVRPETAADARKEILIPYVDAYIDKIALDDGILCVDWQPDY